MKKPTLVALDFESILIPEMWDAIADATKIDDLHLTTRDIPVFDDLMKKRIDIISHNKIPLKKMQKITGRVRPLKGAPAFLKWLRENYQVVIISDTFYEFVGHLLKRLDYPTLFCNSFDTNGNGDLVHYHRRNPGDKREVIEAFKHLEMKVVAVGDSYNDVGMLEAADSGIFLNASEKVAKEFPQFPVAKNYEELKTHIQKAS